MTLNERLNRGELVPIGSAVYAKCRDCGSIVQVNKFLLGGLHFCTPFDAEETQKPRTRR